MNTVKYWRNPLIDAADISDIPRADVAPEPDHGALDAIEMILLENQLSAFPGVVSALHVELNRLAYRLAAEAIRHIFLSLPATPKTIAMRLVILGEEKSIREVAKEAGFTHTAVNKEVRKLRGKVSTILQSIDG